MLIKRKDLTTLVDTIEGELQDGTSESLTTAIEVLLLGMQRLLATPDPVDVVPVQDYPFPLRHEYDEEWELK